jgi:hypothetical protein
MFAFGSARLNGKRWPPPARKWHGSKIRALGLNSEKAINDWKTYLTKG